MNVRLQYTISFTAGVYYGAQFRTNSYTLSLWMVTNSHDPEDHEISFERIKHFVYSKMDSTVFINSAETDQCRRLIDAGLNVTTLPGDPVDQLIGIMLYYKLNAINEERMFVVETELSSQLGSGMVYLHSDNENIDLDYYPEWWTTADLVHCEPDLIEPDKVVSMHQHAAWRDLDLAWPEAESTKNSDNTVVFADFGKNETK
jgi:hypothetical protein